jgi:hypothetical protein
MPFDGQNNPAVFSQRVKTGKKALDDFPTPPWAAWSLCQTLGIRGGRCLEPAANRGWLVRGLTPFFDEVVGCDIKDYRADFPRRDFLGKGWEGEVGKFDWIITNPPFIRGLDFFERAVALRPRCGVAMLLRTQWVEGAERYARLFSKLPIKVCYFVERLAMIKGRFDPHASTATSYSWFVYGKGEGNVWLPPGVRDAWMERHGSEFPSRRKRKRTKKSENF